MGDTANMGREKDGERKAGVDGLFLAEAVCLEAAAVVPRAPSPLSSTDAIAPVPRLCDSDESGHCHACSVLTKGKDDFPFQGTCGTLVGDADGDGDTAIVSGTEKNNNGVVISTEGIQDLSLTHLIFNCNAEGQGYSDPDGRCCIHSSNLIGRGATITQTFSTHSGADPISRGDSDDSKDDPPSFAPPSVPARVGGGPSILKDGTVSIGTDDETRFKDIIPEGDDHGTDDDKDDKCREDVVLVPDGGGMISGDKGGTSCSEAKTELDSAIYDEVLVEDHGGMISGDKSVTRCSEGKMELESSISMAEVMEELCSDRRRQEDKSEQQEEEQIYKRDEQQRGQQQEQQKQQEQQRQQQELQKQQQQNEVEEEKAKNTMEKDQCCHGCLEAILLGAHSPSRSTDTIVPVPPLRDSDDKGCCHAVSVFTKGHDKFPSDRSGGTTVDDGDGDTSIVNGAKMDNNDGVVIITQDLSCTQLIFRCNAEGRGDCDPDNHYSIHTPTHSGSDPVSSSDPDDGNNGPASFPVFVGGEGSILKDGTAVRGTICEVLSKDGGNNSGDNVCLVEDGGGIISGDEGVTMCSDAKKDIESSFSMADVLEEWDSDIRQLEDKSDKQLENKSDEQLENKSDEQLEDKSDEQLEDKSDEQPEDKSDEQPEDQSDEQEEDKGGRGKAATADDVVEQVNLRRSTPIAVSKPKCKVKNVSPVDFENEKEIIGGDVTFDAPISCFSTGFDGDEGNSRNSRNPRLKHDFTRRNHYDRHQHHYYHRRREAQQRRQRHMLTIVIPTPTNASNAISLPKNGNDAGDASWCDGVHQSHESHKYRDHVRKPRFEDHPLEGIETMAGASVTAEATVPSHNETVDSVLMPPSSSDRCQCDCGGGGDGVGSGGLCRWCGGWYGDGREGCVSKGAVSAGMFTGVSVDSGRVPREVVLYLKGLEKHPHRHDEEHCFCLAGGGADCFDQKQVANESPHTITLANQGTRPPPGGVVSPHDTMVNDSDNDFDIGAIYPASQDSKYEWYGVRVEHDQDDKAIEIALYSLQRPHMRSFHAAWISFFVAFFTWFAITPLLSEVQISLGLTKEEIWTSSICGTAGTILMRIIMGPLCDKYGARSCMAWILATSSIPTACTGLVQTSLGLSILRLFIGIAGSSFVACQCWTSCIFVREVAGTANALASGWGNLGGGVTQIIMGSVLFPLLRMAYDNNNTSYFAANEKAWRTASVIPAVISFLASIIIVQHTDDSPKGNYHERRRDHLMPTISAYSSLRSAFKDINAWILFLQYGCCFGVEVTMNNAAALYFKTEFHQTTEASAALASVFGWMNLFARGLGGFTGDVSNARWGMGGRQLWQFVSLLTQGMSIIVFASARSLAGAVFAMVLFSVLVQGAEGSTFGIVPYVNAKFTGGIVGLVGAGGNVGGVMFATVFREYEYRRAFLIMGIAVMCSSLLTFLLNIQHDKTAGWLCSDLSSSSVPPFGRSGCLVTDDNQLIGEIGAVGNVSTHPGTTIIVDEGSDHQQNNHQQIYLVSSGTNHQ